MKNFKKLIPFAVVIALLFSLTLLVSADNEYVKWEISEDMSTLTGDGKVYTRYEEPFAFNINATKVYRYANYAKNSTTSFGVRAAYEGADLVYSNQGDIYCATDEAKASLDRFFSGEGNYYLVTAKWDFSTLDVAVKDAIFESKGENVTRTEDVYGLSNYSTEEIVIFDESDSFYYALGRVFWIDGRYWFVDYSTLPNNYFTADGEFSFRSGEVTLRAVDESLNEAIIDAERRMEYRSTDTTWEDYDPYYEKDTSDLPEYFFWIVFSLINFACPAFVGGGAAIVANLKCLKKPKYFYCVTAATAVWIFCAVIIAVMVA